MNKENLLIDLKMNADYIFVRDVINTFAERYGVLSVNSIGESILGKSIYCLTLGDPCASNEIVYVGALSADDWITTLMLLRFVNEYCEYSKSGATVFGTKFSKIYNNCLIHVIPQLNPDGVDIRLNGFDKESVLYERMSRTGIESINWIGNAKGCDLTSNFFEDIHYACEAESGALMNYIKYNPMKSVISFSMGDGEIVAPQNNIKLGYIQKILGYDTRICNMQGTLADWSAKNERIFSCEIKCKTPSNKNNFSQYYKSYVDIRQMLFLYAGVIN